MPTPSPFPLWVSGIALATMIAEAQAVVGLRMAGMAGLWALAPDETTRMITEKQQAFAESALGVGLAIISGHSPDRVLDAAVGPLGRRTRANSRRLVRAYARRPR